MNLSSTCTNILTGKITASRLDSSNDINNQLLLRSSVGLQADIDGSIILRDREHVSSEVHNEH